MWNAFKLDYDLRPYLNWSEFNTQMKRTFITLNWLVLTGFLFFKWKTNFLLIYWCDLSNPLTESFKSTLSIYFGYFKSSTIFHESHNLAPFFFFFFGCGVENWIWQSGERMIRNNQIISQWCVSRRQLLPCVAPFLALEAELFLCRPVSYYRQPISLWCIIEPACVLYAEMWVTYGLKWVWKRILISQMLLSALQGGVGCMCVCIDVHVSFHMLLHAAGRLVRTLCTGSWETNCAARPGVGGRPSSARSPTHNWIDPLCNSPLWWTSSSISPDHRHSFRGHCVWTYCKCRPQRPHQVTTSLEKCCIANVCVFHLNLVFRRRAESDGKCWTPPFTPRHLSRKSSPPPPSPTQSSLSPLALSFVWFYLLSPPSLLFRLSSFHKLSTNLSVTLILSRLSHQHRRLVNSPASLEFPSARLSADKTHTML